METGQVKDGGRRQTPCSVAAISHLVIKQNLEAGKPLGFYADAAVLTVF